MWVIINITLDQSSKSITSALTGTENSFLTAFSSITGGKCLGFCSGMFKFFIFFLSVIG